MTPDDPASAAIPADRLDAATRHWLAALETRRWFGDKGRAIASVRSADTAPGSPWELVELEFAEGPRRIYQLAAGRADDDAGRGRLVDWLADGFERGEIPTRAARVVCRGIACSGAELAGRLRAARAGAAAPIALGAEMSNTILRVGPAGLLKIYRRVERGVHPEVELLEHVTRAGFRHAPRVDGVIALEPAAAGAAEPAALGLIVERIEGPRVLWDDFTGVRPSDVSRFPDAALGDFAAELGGITAGLHRTLATAGGLPMEAAIDVDAEIAPLDDLADALPRLAAVARPFAVEVLDRAVEIRARLGAATAAGMRPIRTHGDYHLGQVVRGADGRLIILDFEGEPDRPLAERRRLRPAARDVGCMLRSFSYARHASAAGLGRDAAWEARLAARFADAYWTASRQADWAGSDRAAFLALARACELGKALAEVRYELGHRPDWVRVPLRGVLDILER